MHPVFALALPFGRRWTPEHALAVFADRESLVLDDSSRPWQELPGVDRRGLRKQDLDPALVGVFGVIPADRKPPRGPAQRWIVVADQFDRRPLPGRRRVLHRSDTGIPVGADVLAGRTRATLPQRRNQSRNPLVPEDFLLISYPAPSGSATPHEPLGTRLRIVRLWSRKSPFAALSPRLSISLPLPIAEKPRKLRDSGDSARMSAICDLFVEPAATADS